MKHLSSRSCEKVKGHRGTPPAEMSKGDEFLFLSLATSHPGLLTSCMCCCSFGKISQNFKE